MRFYVSYFNHNDFHGCGDHLTYVRNGLSLAGYSAAFSTMPVVSSGSINIFLEFFNKAQVEYLINLNVTQGMKFILIVSEVVTGKSFNNFELNSTKSHYSNRVYWQERFDCFMLLAPYSEAIWCLSDYQLDGYQKLFPEKKIETLPLCFDPIEAQSEAGLKPVKDIPVSFFGHITDYRKEILDAIKVPVFIGYGGLPKPVLVDTILRSHVCLHLSLFENWPYTSNMRHHSLLCHQAYVLSEVSPAPGELDEFVHICSRDRLVSEINFLLSRSDLSQESKLAQQRYASKYSIQNEFSELVQKSIW